MAGSKQKHPANFPLAKIDILITPKKVPHNNAHISIYMKRSEYELPNNLIRKQIYMRYIILIKVYNNADIKFRNSLVDHL